MTTGFAAIFRTLTSRYYRRHVGRFLLCVAGLSAGVAVAGAINLTNSRVIESFSDSLETLAGNSNLRVSDDRGIAPEELERLRFLWDYGQFTPYVRLDGSTQLDSGETQAIVLFGFDFLGARRIRGLETREKAGAEAEAAGGPAPGITNDDGLPEIVVPANSVLGETGDLVTINLDGRRLRFRIQNILENINGRLPPLNTAYMDVAAALPLAPRGLLSGVDIQVEPEAVAELRPRLSAAFPRAQIQTLSERSKITTDMLAAFQMNLQALGIVALLVSAYLVYNTINISVIQRESLIGSLLSLGAGPRQIFAALLAEGVWLGTIGGVIGLIFGYGLSLIASREVDLTLEAVFRLDALRSDATGWSALLISFGLGIVFSALAAWLPAYRGSRIPVASLRRPGRSEFRPRVLYISLAAAVLFLAFFAACFALARHWQSPGPGYGSVAALVGILSALAPLAIWALAKFARLFRASGPARLAAAAAREHILKLAVAVAALGIALSMAGAVSVMVHSFRTTVINWLNTTVVADIYIRSDSGANRLGGELEPELVAALRAHPLVAQALTIRSTERVFRGQMIRLGANEFDIAAERRPLSFVDGDIGDLLAAKAGRGVVVSEVFANRFNLGRGDAFRLGPHELKIHAVFRSYASERGYAFMDASLFDELFGARNPSGVALYLKEQDARGGSIEASYVSEAMSTIATDFKQYPLSISLSTEIRGKAIEIFNQTFRLTYILQMIAGGIAALSVITTLTGLALERRREFATLQALGARPRLVDRAMAFESQIIALASLLIALPGSVLLSLLLIHVINRYSFGWTIVTAVPTADLLTAAGLITALALLAALVPIRLIRKQNIARILKQD